MMTIIAVGVLVLSVAGTVYVIRLIYADRPECEKCLYFGLSCRGQYTDCRNFTSYKE